MGYSSYLSKKNIWVIQVTQLNNLSLKQYFVELIVRSPLLAYCACQQSDVFPITIMLIQRLLDVKSYLIHKVFKFMFFVFLITLKEEVFVFDS
jgi:hypothetical protein